jgi:hypothetical protein
MAGKDERSASNPAVGDDPSASGISVPPPEEDIVIAPRRSSWLSIKRLVGVAALALVVGGVALILWPLLWAADLDDSVQLVNGRLMGEKWGYVSRIDQEGHVVHVSPSLFGWHPVALVVNGETVITVQDRQGGLGDLWKDMPVRASYEVVGEKRFAKWIEIVSNQDAAAGARPSTAATPPAARPAPPSPASPTAERAPAPTPPAPVTAAPAPALPPPASRPGADEPTRVKPATASAPAPRSDRPPRPAAVERPARETLPAVSVPAPRPEPPATASSPASRPQPARGGSESTDVEVTDSAPIIDWLIRESGRR